MRTNFRYCFLSVLLMTGLMAYAERTSIDHDFADMVSKSQLTATNSNKTITTADMIYTCVGTSAAFAKDHLYNSKWSIKLPDRNDKVTTTLIDELDAINIVHYPAEKCDYIKIYVSNDSISWGDPLSGSQITYNSGTIEATVPRDSYYVRIVNSDSSKPVSLIEIIYYQDHCPGCFLFKP